VTHSLPVLTAAELPAAPRWCPGCGNYSVLATLQKVLAGLPGPPDGRVFVAGVGCAGRAAHYLDAYGFQTLPGRAFAVATGVTLADPGLDVWVVTGDADAVQSSGMLHLLRRNVNVKILLLNNEVGGLARGAATAATRPGTRPGTRTRTTSAGSTETPLRLLALAVAAEAGFVARSVDVDVAHLAATLRRAADHVGAAVVEVYQNCRTYNDEVWAAVTDRTLRGDGHLAVADGRPLVFGRDREFGVRLQGLTPVAVRVGKDASEAELLVHDEAAGPGLATLLARLGGPGLPEAFGVLRAVRRPTFGEEFDRVRAEALAKRPAETLDELLGLV